MQATCRETTYIQEINRMDIQEQLPLTEATFFILLSLVPESKHGYAIMKDVKALSDKRVILSTGTLYGALKRLLERGWIARQEELVHNREGRERKAYVLTHLGRRILEAEVKRLGDLVHVARLRTTGEEA
jgi:DNA-binding PadR family transcriptional regulator